MTVPTPKTGDRSVIRHLELQVAIPAYSRNELEELNPKGRRVGETPVVLSLRWELDHVPVLSNQPLVPRRSKSSLRLSTTLGKRSSDPAARAFGGRSRICAAISATFMPVLYAWC